MRKEITLSETEIEKMLKRELKLKDKPPFYFEGGWINRPKIRIVYFE